MILLQAWNRCERNRHIQCVGATVHSNGLWSGGANKPFSQWTKTTEHTHGKKNVLTWSSLHTMYKNQFQWITNKYERQNIQSFENVIE